MNILMLDGIEKISDEFINNLGLEKTFEYVFKVDTLEEAGRIVEAIRMDVILFINELPDESFLNLVFAEERFSDNPIIIVCSNYVWPAYLEKYNNLIIDFYYKPSSSELLKSLLHKKVNEIKKNNKVLHN
jgi:DNA-binding NtrC family response regulator